MKRNNDVSRTTGVEASFLFYMDNEPNGKGDDTL